MKIVITLYYSCCFIFTSSYEAESENFISEFEEHLIVPHLFPSLPKETCKVIYQPGLIILTGRSYFPYQTQGLPDIFWNHRSDTLYTVVILGAFNKKVEYASTTAPILNNKTSTSPPEYWWLQWVKMNVYENDLNSSGTVLKPILESAMPQPNSTHDIIYVVGVYEQSKELKVKVIHDGPNNSTKALLDECFLPILNSDDNFNKNLSLIAGNFFYVTPMKIVLDTSVVRRIRWKD